MLPLPDLVVVVVDAPCNPRFTALSGATITVSDMMMERKHRQSFSRDVRHQQSVLPQT
jgi:hypothetical protein